MEKETYLQDFAERVFSVAETEYQSGAASKNTAKSFLHASVFFEAMKHFAPLTEETLGRIRYSKWKATEIVTAISEGRVPGPDGAVERSLDEEMNGPTGAVPSSPSFGDMSYAARPPAASPSPTAYMPAPAPVAAPQKTLHDSGSDLDLPDVPVFSHSQLASQRGFSAAPGAGAAQPNRASPPQFHQQPPASSPSPQFPSIPSPSPSSNQMAVDPAPGPRPPHDSAGGAQRPSAGFTQFISSRVVYSPKPVNNANINVILEATKLSKNAISALQFDDPETAIKNLRAALTVLTGSDH